MLKQTCLGTTANMFSEAHKNAERTRRHATAFETRDVFVLYGLTCQQVVPNLLG